VEAILGDSSAKIEAVFPKESVKLWQTKARSLLTSFPTGSLFHILESELRISDCFHPPRIEFWIHRFEIVGDLGNDVPSILKKVGDSSNLGRLLNLFAESDEHLRISGRDVATMSSPLHSQENVSFPNETYSHDDHDENTIAKNVSQAFFTQVSQPSTPKQKREPLTSRQPREHEGRTSNQKVDTGNIPPSFPRKSGVVAPTASAEDPVNTVERTAEDLMVKLQEQNHLSMPASSIQKSADQTDVRNLGQGSTQAKDEYWPAGRANLMNGRYLPRYLTKIPKDQQEILETSNAWQPSKTDRQIRGSVPNKVLKEFTARADNAVKQAFHDKKLNDEACPMTKTSNGDVQLNDGKYGLSSNSSSENSDSDEAISWCPTPSRGIQDSALPENSSPLRAPHRRLTPSSPPSGSIITSADCASQHVLSLGGYFAGQSQVEGFVSNVQRGLEACQTASNEQGIRLTSNNAADMATSHEARPNVSCNPSAGKHSPTDRNWEEATGIEADAACLSQTQSDEVQRTSKEIFIPPQTQVSSRVQVQRTPFGQQVSTLIKASNLSGNPAAFPNTTTDDSLSNDPEPRSSTSVVPGTFVNLQAKQQGQSEASSPRSLHKEMGCSEDEQMKEARSEVTNISKYDEIMDTASGAHFSSINEESTDSQTRLIVTRTAKRKYCSDDVKILKPQLSQSIGDRRSCSSPAPPKRPRTRYTLPSLNVITDLVTTRSPSEIAKESRRAFFSNQERALSDSSPVSMPVAKLEESLRDQALGSLTSHSLPQRRTTPRTSLLSRTNSMQGSGKDSITATPRSRQAMFDTYKATYPEYRGNALQFQKACKQIKILHRRRKAPHPSLWDDFIFRRHHDYRDYLLEAAEACEDALPYLQYYTEHIEKPSRMQLVVKPSYVLSLGKGSSIGPGVKSPPAAEHTNTNVVVDFEHSVAASSSASNAQAPRTRLSPAAAFSNRSDRNDEYETKLQDEDELQQTQGKDSSVKQWVELQSMEKALGAESPELGFTEIAEEVEDVPGQDLDSAAEISASSSPGHRAAVSEKRREPIWCDDPDTPFKSFARSYTSLASERRQLKEQVRIDGKGCLKPHVQKVIDIFTLYRK
jgi:hypothetical protein